MWWSLRTLGITSNDDSVMPTGVKDELVPDPLGEAQGSGRLGMPRGPWPGPSASVDAWARSGVAESCPKSAEKSFDRKVSMAFVA